MTRETYRICVLAFVAVTATTVAWLRYGAARPMVATAAPSIARATGTASVADLPRPSPAADPNPSDAVICAAAEDVMAAWADGPMPHDAAVRIGQRLRQWATVSPLAAWHWALQHPMIGVGEDAPSSTAAVLQVVAQQAPATAVDWVDRQLHGVSPPAGASGLVTELVAALLGAGHAAEAERSLRRWADSARGTGVSATALTNVGLYVAAHNSPQAAIDWLTSFPAGPARDSALVTVAAEWTQHNATSALSWALRADGSGASAQPVIGAWAQRDAVAAAEWLQEHEATPQADALIEGFVFHSSMAAEAPIAATAWVSLIQDPQLRRQSLTALARGAKVDSP